MHECYRRVCMCAYVHARECVCLCCLLVASGEGRELRRV